MNDKIIINTISKIHFFMVSFLSFIFLVLSVSFVLLQNGIHIDNISLPNIQIKKLYIKWNEKIHISVNEINIIDDKSDSELKFEAEEINKFFKQLVLFDEWFEFINIKNISFNDTKASFKYKYGERGSITVYSPDFSLKSSLYYKAEYLNLDIDEFHDFKRTIDINGSIIYDTNNLEFTSLLNIDINNDLNINLSINANREKLFYSLESLKDIKNIKHTVELLNLDHSISHWIIEAIDMSSLSIHSLSGWIEYKNLNQAYKNMYVNATINDLKYEYDSELDTIKTVRTELEFKDSTLFIYPKKAYTYGHFLDKSYITLNLSQEQTLLTVNLLFKGLLDQNILNIIEHYGISLPILQNSGVLDTNLKIELNLNTEDVVAEGDFFIKKANIRYVGLDIDIFDTYIQLKDQKVTIDNMRAKYKDIATTKLDFFLDTKNSVGELNFKLDKISFKDIGLSLKKGKKPLAITYKILPTKETIYINNSTWNFNNEVVKVKSMAIAFDSDKLIAHIPKTSLKVIDLASAYVSGEASFEDNSVDLDVDIVKFSYNDVELAKKPAPLKLFYDKKIIIKSKKDIKLTINGLDSTLKNAVVEIEDSTLKIKKGLLSIKDILDTKLSGEYSFKSDSGQLYIADTDFRHNSVGEILNYKNPIKLNIKSKENQIYVESKKFDLDYISNDSEWRLSISSLQKLSNESKVLKDYNVTNGSFTLYKKNNEEDMNFVAQTNYIFNLLVLNNTPVENYIIKGVVDKTSNDISLNINNSVDMYIDKDIKIETKDIGINIDALLDFINRDKSNSVKEDTKVSIFLSSRNSYLYLGENRRVISDIMELQLIHGLVTAQLIHKKGVAVFELKNNEFDLYGENFNDKFLSNVFALSKFRGGSLEFSMNGTTQEYNGVFHVVKTRILEYKVLNNVLAFVNTIPSLMTFSLPGYSRKGLKVKEAYMIFNTKDDTFNITDININSKELDILGRGTASIKRNEIDLLLNLKTDLGSTIANIPVIGYIMLNGDAISTSLSIKGKLDDPKVENLLADDIIVAPLNIIKRTIMLPYHLITGEK